MHLHPCPCWCCTGPAAGESSPWSSGGWIQCLARPAVPFRSYVDALSTVMVTEGLPVAKSAVARIPFIGRFAVALQV